MKNYLGKEDNIRDLFLRPSLLGAVDGLITTFVIIAAGVSARISKKSTLIIALSSLIADALSMGVAETISSRSSPNVSRADAFLKGIVCFTSFALLGSIPIAVYALNTSNLASEITSILTFLVLLIIIGCAQAYVTREKYAVLEVTGLGIVAASAAYGIAKLSI